MTKEWKELEGMPLKIDVNVTRAEALASSYPPNSLAVTTDGGLCLNGVELANTNVGIMADKSLVDYVIGTRSIPDSSMADAPVLVKFTEDGFIAPRDADNALIYSVSENGAPVPDNEFCARTNAVITGEDFNELTESYPLHVQFVKIPYNSLNIYGIMLCDPRGYIWGVASPLTDENGDSIAYENGQIKGMALFGFLTQFSHDSVKSTAEAAKSTAEAAKSTAEAAKSTAEAAKSTAEAAKSTAEGKQDKITSVGNGLKIDEKGIIGVSNATPLDRATLGKKLSYSAVNTKYEFSAAVGDTLATNNNGVYTFSSEYFGNVGNVAFPTALSIPLLKDFEITNGYIRGRASLVDFTLGGNALIKKGAFLVEYTGGISVYFEFEIDDANTKATVTKVKTRGLTRWWEDAT